MLVRVKICDSSSCKHPGTWYHIELVNCCYWKLHCSSATWMLNWGLSSLWQFSSHLLIFCSYDLWDKICVFSAPVTFWGRGEYIYVCIYIYILPDACSSWEWFTLWAACTGCSFLTHKLQETESLRFKTRGMLPIESSWVFTSFLLELVVPAVLSSV